MCSFSPRGAEERDEELAHRCTPADGCIWGSCVSTLKNPRTHGQRPFKVAVIHGGPGAGGEMEPVGRRLASDLGVLEPIQTAGSVEGQIQELRTILERRADLPVSLVGFSWGAWLSLIVTARYPGLIKKLILVGSGPFEEKYVTRIEETRLRRLSKGRRKEYESVVSALNNPDIEDKNPLLARLGKLASRTDAFDPIRGESDELNLIDYRSDLFLEVWKEAAEMRRSGELLDFARQVQCPVVAIHGDYDPHPAEGVEKPLSATLKNFRFILLKNCGHKPWIERQAREEFFRIIKNELH
jgi:pimeloyl-ACP methyl ester carboxylesterase